MTIEGSWPDTDLIATSEFAGEARSMRFRLYYVDPVRHGKPFPSALECATGILEAVAES